MFNLFITELSETGRILQYSIYSAEYDIDIECVAHLEVEEIKNYTDFKIVSSELIELTEEEKQIDICLDDLKSDKVKNSKIELENWLHSNPLFSTIHNVQGEYYTVTQEKQMLLAMAIASATVDISRGKTPIITWNFTNGICEEWTFEELANLKDEIELYVKPRITKQQHYEVTINACQTKEELDAITFDYEVI